MIGLRIRVATSADIADLSDVYRRSSLSNEHDRASLLAHPDALVFSERPVAEGRTRVAVIHGRIAGFATTRVAGRVGELEDLFVDPAWMRRGVGRALVDDVLATARALGVRRVEVTANPHARTFYDRMGFVVAGVVRTRFGTAERMRLDLVP